MWGGDDGGAHLDQLEAYCHGTQFLIHAVREYGFMSIEEAVHVMTGKLAEHFFLPDRGVIAPGYRADLNVIDFAGLHLQAPHFVNDLPAQGRRLVQAASGYRATVVNGVPVAVDGQPTGDLPGGLIRGPQAAPGMIFLSGTRKELAVATRAFQSRVEAAMLKNDEPIHHINHTTNIYVLDPEGHVAGVMYHSDPVKVMVDTVTGMAKAMPAAANSPAAAGHSGHR